jgi:hypothetical protein
MGALLRGNSMLPGPPFKIAVTDIGFSLLS